MILSLSRFVPRAMVAAVLACGSLATPALAERPDSFADLAERLSPSVVNISTSQEVKRPKAPDFPMLELPPGSPFEEFFKEFFDQQGEAQRRVNSLGSGFVIDPAGFIVTNNHVIEGADQIDVTFIDGRRLKATIVGKDPATDVALLKVESATPLAHVPFGNSDVIRVGDWVMAIGNPFGLGGSVSAGIVSARNRDINAGRYDDFIQTDAAINRGNSGGPLFNLNGEVIGVNTAIISPSGGSIGIGFAIPSNDVARVIAQLRQFGETRRGWIGVRIQTVTEDLAEGFGLDRARGAIVAEVLAGGPAEAAGLQRDDIIVKFDGKEVGATRSLPRIVAETDVGRTVEVEVIRNRQTVILQITVGRLDEAALAAAPATPEPEPEAPATTAMDVESLGLSLSPITEELRSRYGIPAEVKGVVVTDIKGTSPAGFAESEGRIREGDVIVEVQQSAITTPDDVAQKVKDVIDANGKVVLLLLNRKGELSFAALRLDQG